MFPRHALLAWALVLSLPTPVAAQQVEEPEYRPLVATFQSVPHDVSNDTGVTWTRGLLYGAILGAIIGAEWNADEHESWTDRLEDTLKGAAIGALLGVLLDLAID